MRMTNKYFMDLLAARIKCNAILSFIKKEDEFVSTIHCLIETWAKKTGYDTQEIIEILLSDEIMIRDEIERNRKNKLQS